MFGHPGWLAVTIRLSRTTARTDQSVGADRR